MSTPGESHAVPAQITLIARHNAPVGDLSAIGMPEEWGPVKRMFCLVVLPLRTRVSGGGRTGRGIGLVV